MGTEEPDVWPRTAEISFEKHEVLRHEFYCCFKHDGVVESSFDALFFLLTLWFVCPAGLSASSVLGSKPTKVTVF